MKSDPSPEALKGKTPHERFEELGKRLLAVPRSKVAALEKKWERQRQRKRKQP